MQRDVIKPRLDAVMSACEIVSANIVIEGAEQEVDNCACFKLRYQGGDTQEFGFNLVELEAVLREMPRIYGVPDYAALNDGDDGLKSVQQIFRAAHQALLKHQDSTVPITIPIQVVTLQPYYRLHEVYADPLAQTTALAAE